MDWKFLRRVELLVVKDQSNDHTCDNPEIFFCIVGSEATVLKSQVAKKEDMIEEI